MNVLLCTTINEQNHLKTSDSGTIRVLSLTGGTQCCRVSFYIIWSFVERIKIYCNLHTKSSGPHALRTPFLYGGIILLVYSYIYLPTYLPTYLLASLGETLISGSSVEGKACGRAPAYAPHEKLLLCFCVHFCMVFCMCHTARREPALVTRQGGRSRFRGTVSFK